MEFLHSAENWILISFLIFAVFAARFGVGKFLAMLDAKIASIRTDIESAEKLRAEAESLLADYRRKKAEAAKEAEDIIAGARAATELIRKDVEEDIAEMMTRKEAQLAARLKRMEDATKAEIQTYAAELAVKATAKIIGSKLDQAANDRLIAASIKDVADKLR